MTAADHAAVLAAVEACPDRGGPLPHPPPGHAGWVACRAGRGSGAGATLEDCVRCRLGLPAPTRTGDAGPDPNGRVRAGLLCPVLAWGGAETWQATLAGSTDPGRVAWRGCVVTGGQAAARPGRVAELRGHMPVGFGFEAARALAARCDVLIEWAVIDVPASLTGLARPPRVICVCHAPLESAWGVGIYSEPRGVDRFVCVSELAVPTIPECHRAAAAVIENAVDAARLVPSRPRAEVRAGWGVPAGAKVAGYLGRTTAEKNPGAMAALAPHLPDGWYAVVVGDGRPGDDLGAVDHPRFRRAAGTGDVGSVLAAFDALVVPSHYESFGLTMVEGLLAGVPVVSTPVGVAKLHPGLTRLVPSHPSGAALAAALAADVIDPAGTAARVGRAREFARSRWGTERFGREWTDLIVTEAAARASADEGWPPCPARDDSCRCPARECRDPARGPALGRTVAVAVPGILPRRTYAVTAADCARCPGPMR